MSIVKRVLALAAASATALVLGGVLGTAHQATHVDAAGPLASAIGCANSTSNLDIAFPTVGGILSGSPQVTAGLSAAGIAPGALNVLTPNGVVLCGAVFQDGTIPPAGYPAGVADADPNTIDGGTITFNLNSFNGVASILESNTNNASIPCGSATPPTGVGATLGVGAVAGVTQQVVLTARGPAGTSFVLNFGGLSTALIINPATAATISAALNAVPSIIAVGGVTVTGGPTGNGVGNAPVIITFNAFGPQADIVVIMPDPPFVADPTATAVTSRVGVTPVVGVAPAPATLTTVGGLESCQGGVPNGPTWVSPSPSNTVHVAFRAGATFGTIGTATPQLLLTATYNRFPALSGAVFGPVPAGAVAGVPGPGALIAVGPSTLTTGTAVISVVLPIYALSVTASPTTIPAASGTGSGSTITAALFRSVANTCIPITVGSGFFICTGNGLFATTVAGAEPGAVTFATSSGVFGGTSATPGTFAQQVTTVQCGAVPGIAPIILVPLTGVPLSFSFSSCISASTTLFGGGAAGTAIVTANFVGSITGATASGSTTVALSPTAATVNLSRGCNEVITPSSVAAGANVQTIVDMVKGTTVVGLFRFNNSAKVFEAGFFNTPGAPTEFGTVGPSQSLFICVTGSGTFPTGAF